MRMFRAALAAVVLCSVVAVASPTVTLAKAGNGQVTDPQLLADIADATASRSEGGSASVTVEVLTSDLTGVGNTVLALGGTVTGSVPGEVVQARVPIDQLSALAGTSGVEHLQSPRRAGYVPSDSPLRIEAGTGTTVGDEVTITNADEWQDAGFTGAGVKVGIVDYFDMSLWDATELGPKPTPGGRLFCQDSAGYGLCIGPNINDTFGDIHGLAVAEIVKDMAPGVEIYIATVATVSDLQAAINWFATNGVTIVTRSLGAAYDGPGDGTGPLAAVVDSAVGKGMTWFNSGGNDGEDAYIRRTVAATVSASAYGVSNSNPSGPAVSAGSGQYVDFDPNAGVDTWLRFDAGRTSCVLFDGVRWANDWYLPANQRTDYSLEFFEPISSSNEFDDHWNPTAASQVYPIDIFTQLPGVQHVYNANQTTGASPLEAEDLCVVPDNVFGPLTGIVFMRMRRSTATPVGNPDTVEVALSDGWTEFGYFNKAGSAAKPVVDSKNSGLVAVGAVDSATGSAPPAPGGSNIAYYSSQGPTNDGRIKPDVSAPAGFFSTSYTDTFQGTSAASPVAAGAAALLLGAGLATPGGGLAALVKHFSQDLGTPGPDNAFGFGKVLLPAPPTPAAPTTPAKYVPLPLPVRGLDTRAGANHVGPASLTGPFLKESVIDFAVLSETIVPDSGVSAVAINLTSVGSTGASYLQAYPYLRGANGATSTLNIATAGTTRPNFAIVPVGQDGKISVYLPAGGNVIIDVLGYYLDGQTLSTDGRFVPLAEPERWMDTRGFNGAPLPIGYVAPARTSPNETVNVAALPTSLVPVAGISALVVNITAANPAANGYLIGTPTGAVGAIHSNVNYTTGAAAANTAIIPLGSGNGISVFTTQRTDVIVDIVGYITNTDASSDTLGLFKPIVPGRAIDTRKPTPNPFTAGQSRTFTLIGLTSPAPVVPVDASGVVANLTVVNAPVGGFLTVYPNNQPATSNLNFSAGKTVANAALLALSDAGTVTATMSQTGNVIIDITGYFLPGLVT